MSKFNLLSSSSVARTSSFFQPTISSNFRENEVLANQCGSSTCDSHPAMLALRVGNDGQGGSGMSGGGQGTKHSVLACKVFDIMSIRGSPARCQWSGTAHSFDQFCCIFYNQFQFYLFFSVQFEWSKMRKRENMILTTTDSQRKVRIQTNLFNFIMLFYWELCMELHVSWLFASFIYYHSTHKYSRNSTCHLFGQMLIHQIPKTCWSPSETTSSYFQLFNGSISCACFFVLPIMVVRGSDGEVDQGD